MKRKHRDEPKSVLIPLPEDDSDCAVQAPVPYVDLGFSKTGLREVLQEKIESGLISPEAAKRLKEILFIQ